MRVSFSRRVYLDLIVQVILNKNIIKHTHVIIIYNHHLGIPFDEWDVIFKLGGGQNIANSESYGTKQWISFVQGSKYTFLDSQFEHIPSKQTNIRNHFTRFTCESRNICTCLQTGNGVR